MKRVFRDEVPKVVYALSNINLDGMPRLGAIILECSDDEFEKLQKAFNMDVRVLLDKSSGTFFLCGLGFRIPNVPIDGIDPETGKEFDKIVPNFGAVLIYRALDISEARIIDNELVDKSLEELEYVKEKETI